MYGYIYKTTNLINGKIYIGQKKATEFLGNDYLGSGKYLKCAIIHYGKEAFNVELLDIANSKKELDELEKYYIKMFNSTNHDIGYNIANGALGGDTYSNLTDKEKKERNNKHSETCKMNYKPSKWVYKEIENNNYISKLVHEEELDKYLEQGYQIGVDPIRRNIMAENTKKIHTGKKISKNQIEKYKQVRLNKSEEELNEWYSNIAKGVSKYMNSKSPQELHDRGVKMNKFKGHKCAWVNNGIEQHFIFLEDIDIYLNNGYVTGMLKRKNKNNE